MCQIEDHTAAFTSFTYLSSVKKADAYWVTTSSTIKLVVLAAYIGTSGISSSVFNFGGYSACTPSFCDPCMQAVVGCIPALSVPGIGSGQLWQLVELTL